MNGKPRGEWGRWSTGKQTPVREQNGPTKQGIEFCQTCDPELGGLSSLAPGKHLTREGDRREHGGGHRGLLSGWVSVGMMWNDVMNGWVSHRSPRLAWRSAGLGCGTHIWIGTKEVSIHPERALFSFAVEGAGT